MCDQSVLHNSILGCITSASFEILHTKSMHACEAKNGVTHYPTIRRDSWLLSIDIYRRSQNLPLAIYILSWPGKQRRYVFDILLASPIARWHDPWELAFCIDIFIFTAGGVVDTMGGLGVRYQARCASKSMN